LKVVVVDACCFFLQAQLQVEIILPYNGGTLLLESQSQAVYMRVTLRVEEVDWMDEFGWLIFTDMYDTSYKSAMN
jgi:hypothetical protein